MPKLNFEVETHMTVYIKQSKEVDRTVPWHIGLHGTYRRRSSLSRLAGTDKCFYTHLWIIQLCDSNVKMIRDGRFDSRKHMLLLAKMYFVNAKIK